MDIAGNEITKEEFKKSLKPLTYIVSVNPETREHSFDLLEGDGGWMIELLHKDFPERMLFIRRNEKAAEFFGRRIHWQEEKEKYE